MFYHVLQRQLLVPARPRGPLPWEKRPGKQWVCMLQNPTHTSVTESSSNRTPLIIPPQVQKVQSRPPGGFTSVKAAIKILGPSVVSGCPDYYKGIKTCGKKKSFELFDVI